MKTRMNSTCALCRPAGHETVISRRRHWLWTCGTFFVRANYIIGHFKDFFMHI